MALLKPKYYVSSFEHMSIERLKQQGIKLLLCDIDNTLVSYDEKPGALQQCPCYGPAYRP